MTREEHQARAMLLGLRTYMRQEGYYVGYEGGRVKRLDAMTLEPVSSFEAEQRQRASRTRNGSWYEEND
jgi:hypothetical protein